MFRLWKLGYVRAPDQIESLAVREVDENEARRDFSALLRAVEETGEIIEIARGGRVVARLEPLTISESSQAPGKTAGANLMERFQSLRQRIERAKPQADDLT